MIVYLAFEIKLHKLEIKTEEELDRFQKMLKARLMEFSNSEYDSDVEMELIESGGTIDGYPRPN